MREFRERVDVRERPEARVVDRVLVAALGVHIATLPGPKAVELAAAIHAAALAGLEVEGYDRRSSRLALIARLRLTFEGPVSSNPVRVAARRKAEGLPAAGRRVRHADRLTTA